MEVIAKFGIKYAAEVREIRHKIQHDLTTMSVNWSRTTKS